MTAHVYTPPSIDTLCFRPTVHAKYGIAYFMEQNFRKFCELDSIHEFCYKSLHCLSNHCNGMAFWKFAI